MNNPMITADDFFFYNQQLPYDCDKVANKAGGEPVAAHSTNVIARVTNVIARADDQPAPGTALP